MTETDDQTFSGRVAIIRRRFLSELPMRVHAISDVLEDTGGEDFNETQARKVHRMLHDIAGSAAMLELHDIEAAARRGLAVAEVSDARNASLDGESRSTVQKSLHEMLAIATPNATDI